MESHISKARTAERLAWGVVGVRTLSHANIQEPTHSLIEVDGPDHRCLEKLANPRIFLALLLQVFAGL